MHLFLGILATISFLALSATIVLNAVVGTIYLFRRNPNKRADWCFGALLFAFALTSVHHVFILQGMYEKQPALLFLPVYHTLSFGVLVFFSVKLRLFPGYRFRGTDSKHLILPLGQMLYFLLIFLFTDVVFRQALGRKFYSPFYGGLEMALYIGTFSAYLLGAYRYIRYKVAHVRRSENVMEIREALLLRRLVRVLIILFWINSAYILADFAMYELLKLNMHNFRGFTRFGELSFAAMSGWVGLMGISLLARNPYHSLSEQAFSRVKWLAKKGVKFL